MLFGFFFYNVLEQVWSYALILVTCYVITIIARQFIIKDCWVLFCFSMAITADLIAITTVVYLSGGPFSSYFTIYLFYIVITGVLYHYSLAVILSILISIIYGVFLVLCHMGMISPLILYYGNSLPIPTYTPIAHFAFVIIFSLILVYIVKVATFFSREYERNLELKNKELSALYEISSTIRSIRSVKSVINQVLSGVVKGLDVKLSMLITMQEKDLLSINISSSKLGLNQVQSMLGNHEWNASESNSLILSHRWTQLSNHQTIHCHHLNELFKSDYKMLNATMIDEFIDTHEISNFIAAPLVVEGRLIGVLIGFMAHSFLSDDQLSSFEAFANHAAITIDAASSLDQLAQLNDELRRVSEVKSEFLATMSHELRTPLTAIIGFSELLVEGVMGDMSSEQMESLHEVLRNANDLLELINGLLDLTKVESGRMSMDLQCVNIQSIISRVTQSMMPLFQKKKQQLNVKIESNVPYALLDERKIQQALINLMGNANKFAPNEGQVNIILDYLDALTNMPMHVQEWLNKQCHSNSDFDLWKGFIYVRVQDDGIGIPIDALDNVFEMFRQADSSITRSYGGTGLGLALAKRFIEMHHGMIWAENVLGSGACFSVLLPVQSCNP